MKITIESMQEQQSPPKAPAPKPEPEPQKTELEKLKAMSGKDRAWYIWAYYKFHILAVVIAIGLIWQIGLVIYHSTFTSAFHCMYLNSYSSEGPNPAPLEDQLREYLGLGKKETITVETGYIAFGDDATEYSYANMAKITALSASKDLDVLIADTACTNHYAELGAYMDLETFLPADLLEEVRDRLYYATGEDGTTIACAIDISGTDFVTESNLTQDIPLLGIIVNSVRTDNAVALIRCILEP